MTLIKHKDSIVFNLDQVTHIELAQTASEYHIVFYHHFSYMLEEYKNIKENCQTYIAKVIGAQEIDSRVKKKIILNKLEELKMAEIINELNER